jgi:PAS domain S-box-containing protein
MIFYKDKFRQIRKEKRLSMESVAKKINASRVSISIWERGIRVPSEKYIRLLSQALNISVDEISDLQIPYPLSELDLTKAEHSWSSFIDLTPQNIQSKIDDLTLGISYLKIQLEDAGIIINALMKSMKDILYIKNTKHKYLIANKAFFDNLSLHENFNVTNKTDRDFFASQEALINIKEDQDVLLTGKAIIEKENFIPGSRKKRWGIISKIPIFDKKRTITGILGIFTDITDRKADETIREALETALHQSIDTVSLEFNPHHKLVYLSESVEAMYGYPKDNFLEKRSFWVDTCLHPDSKEKEKSYIQKNEWPLIREFKIIKPDGSIRHIESTIMKKDFLGKQCIGFIDRDITNRKREEEIKKEQEIKELLTELLDNMHDAFGLFSLKYNKYIYLNKAWKKLWGYSLDKFYCKGLDFTINKCIHPDDREEQRAYYENKNMPNDRTFRIIRPNGEIRWLKVKISSKTYMGKLDSILSHVEDITDNML